MKNILQIALGGLLGALVLWYFFFRIIPPPAPPIPQKPISQQSTQPIIPKPSQPPPLGIEKQMKVPAVKPNEPEMARKENGKDRPTASIDNYEYKLHTAQLRSHESIIFSFSPLIFNVLDIKKGKLYVIIGAKGYPSLRIDGGEIGSKYEYDAIDHYEIEIIRISDNYAELKILERKKISN